MLGLSEEGERAEDAADEDDARDGEPGEEPLRAARRRVSARSMTEGGRRRRRERGRTMKAGTAVLDSSMTTQHSFRFLRGSRKVSGEDDGRQGGRAAYRWRKSSCRRKASARASGMRRAGCARTIVSQTLRVERVKAVSSRRTTCAHRRR